MQYKKIYNQILFEIFFQKFSTETNNEGRKNKNYKKSNVIKNYIYTNNAVKIN